MDKNIERHKSQSQKDLERLTDSLNGASGGLCLPILLQTGLTPSLDQLSQCLTQMCFENLQRWRTSLVLKLNNIFNKFSGDFCSCSSCSLFSLCTSGNNLAPSSPFKVNRRLEKWTNKPTKKKKKEQKKPTEIWQSYGMQRNPSNLISENRASP